MISALLKTREGRIFFALLIEESGYLKNGKRGTDADTYFAEGERSIGGRVFNMVWKCEEDKPLACMREYRAWLKQLQMTAMAGLKGEETQE